MKRKLALALVAAMVVGSLAGCGGSDNSSKDSGKTESGSTANEDAGEASDAGSEGQNLVVEVGPDPETIDPALNSAIDGGNMIIHAFEGLLIQDEENVIQPGQAESFDVSDDGLTYTFHLRDGLKWSDGSDLTANDFVYSWKRVVDPNTAAPYAETMLNTVKGYEEAINGNVDALAVSAPDDKTLVVELAAPCLYFDKIVAFATLMPVQQATVEANGDAWATSADTYITNGPFYIKEWVPGSHVLMAKNPNYWDADAIKLDTLKFLLMEDTNASYSAWQSGEALMIKDVPIDEIEALQDNEEFHLDPTMGTYYISFNLEKEPFNNPLVREALTLCIDREYVADTIMQGTYTAATNLVGPGISDAEDGSSFQDVTTEKYGDHYTIGDFDAQVEKAKELLAEAGYPDGEGFPTIEYMTNDASYHKPLAEYLQQEWQDKLGINMDINVVEWSVFTASRRNGDFQIARNGWVMDYDDPSSMLDIFQTGNGNNDGKYSNEELDNLLKAARATTDKAEHYDLLHQAEQHILENNVMAPVAYYNDFYLQSSKVKNTWHNSNGFWYFMYATIEE